MTKNVTRQFLHGVLGELKVAGLVRDPDRDMPIPAKESFQPDSIHSGRGRGQ